MKYLLPTLALTTTMAMGFGLSPAFADDAANASASPAAAQTDAQATIDKEVAQQLAIFDNYLLANQGPQAMQKYHAVRGKFPNHPLVKAYEGKILMLQNNAAGATTALTAALEMQPNQPLATALMANLEFRSMKVEEARKRVNDALAVHPDAWELLQIAGEMDVAQQKFAEAQPRFEKILANVNNPPAAKGPAHAQLGAILAQQDKPAEAAGHLRQALAVSWHVGVALSLVQQLDKADAAPADTRAAIADLRKRMAAASSHPQYAQIKAQVDTQLAPIEAKLQVAQVDEKLQELDQLMENHKGNTMALTNKSREIRSLIDRVVKDETEKQAKLKALQARDLRSEMLLIRWGQEQKYSPAWLNQRADALDKLSQGLEGKVVEEAAAVAKEARATASQAAAAEGEGALALAQEGWTLEDFVSPLSDKVKILKEKGLPERYSLFSPPVKEALKKYYQPLADKRGSHPLDEAVPAWLKKPEDPALAAKVIEAITARLKAIDLEQEAVTFEAVLPDRVWSEPHPYNRAINLDDALSDRRERAYSINSDLNTSTLRYNHRWAEMIEGKTRVVAVYPRADALEDRAMAKVNLGQYKEAYDDYALALAVLVWERANTLGSAVALGDPDWSYRGLTALKMLGELAQNKPTTKGKHASAPVQAYLQNLKNKRFDAVVDFVMADHADKGFAQYLVQTSASQYYKQPVLAAMAQAYRKASADKKAALEAKAEKLFNYSHPDWVVIRLEKETDPAKRDPLWKNVLNYDPRHVQANIQVARQLEKEGDKVGAMHLYNVAAGGGNTASLKGDQQLAARERDRLEGPTPDINALVKIYFEPMKEFNGLMNKNQSKLEAAKVEAIANRFLNNRGNPSAVLPYRTDARKILDDHELAIEDLTKLIEINPKGANVYHGAIGDNYRSLGQFAKAYDHYTQSIQLELKSALVYYFRGVSSVYLGNYESAMRDFNEALTLDPEHRASLAQRSEIYEYIMNNDAKALADAQKLLELRKKDNPNGNNFTLELRINNMQMKIARKNLGF